MNNLENRKVSDSKIKTRSRVLYFSIAIVVGGILLWVFGDFSYGSTVVYGVWLGNYFISKGYIIAISSYIALVLAVFFVWINPLKKWKLKKINYKMSKLNINTVLKVFMMAFMIFLSYILYIER